MPLKYKYPTKQEIPAEQSALYVEREGAFYLDVEGVTDKVKADELRTHNIELRKQIEEPPFLTLPPVPARCSNW